MIWLISMNKKIISLGLVFLLVCGGVVIAEDSIDDCNWWCSVKKFPGGFSDE